MNVLGVVFETKLNWQIHTASKLLRNSIDGLYDVIYTKYVTPVCCMNKYMIKL